jgi:hypothetical protein
MRVLWAARPITPQHLPGTSGTEMHRQYMSAAPRALPNTGNESGEYYGRKWCLDVTIA